jgi:hypothetical protein
MATKNYLFILLVFSGSVSVAADMGSAGSTLRHRKSPMASPASTPPKKKQLAVDTSGSAAAAAAASATAQPKTQATVAGKCTLKGFLNAFRDSLEPDSPRTPNGSEASQASTPKSPKSPTTTPSWASDLFGVI